MEALHVKKILTDHSITLRRTIVYCTFVRTKDQKESSCMTTNQIAYWRLQEEQRANRAQEGLKGEENTIKARDANTRAGELSVKQQEVGIKKDTLAEQHRHNVTQEVISGITGGIDSITDIVGVVGKLAGGKKK